MRVNETPVPVTCQRNEVGFIVDVDVKFTTKGIGPWISASADVLLPPTAVADEAVNEATGGWRVVTVISFVVVLEPTLLVAVRRTV
ncbi:hypothetical protein DSECCO2_426150 [anaerobic digester metagenome]